MKYETTKNFETSSRKLEQFLFIHDIHHIGLYKNEDNMTVWQYPYTEEVMEVVSEFRAIQRRRQMKQMN